MSHQGHHRHHHHQGTYCSQDPCDRPYQPCYDPCRPGQYHYQAYGYKCDRPDPCCPCPPQHHDHGRSSHHVGGCKK